MILAMLPTIVLAMVLTILRCLCENEWMVSSMIGRTRELAGNSINQRKARNEIWMASSWRSACSALLWTANWRRCSDCCSQWCRACCCLAKRCPAKRFHSKRCHSKCRANRLEHLNRCSWCCPSHRSSPDCPPAGSACCCSDRPVVRPGRLPAMFGRRTRHPHRFVDLVEAIIRRGSLESLGYHSLENC